MENKTKSVEDTVLNAMLEQSQFSKPQEEEYWYSRGNQKKMIYDLGSRLMVSEEMSPSEAIALAQEYVDTFYSMILSPQVWKKD